jgi:tRNA wybutosine-synthesizing protein 2
MARRFREILEDSLVIPEGKRQFLPSGFQRIGDIVVLNLAPEVMEYSDGIARAVLRNYPYVKSVWRRAGPVSGDLREPGVEHIGGARRSATIHTENACRYRIDIAKVMLSKGNVKERARIPPLVKRGETVVDMFAGIGYFSLPVARHSQAGVVYSIEKNPEAMALLRENIRLNSLEKRVVPVLGDCRTVNIGRMADRVIMGYLPKTYSYLSNALKCLKPGGGVIHYHDTFHESELWERPTDILEVEAFKRGFELKKVSHRGIVKEYAPGVQHVVMDAVFSGPS